MGLDFCLSSFSFVAASHSAFLKVCGSSGPTAVETSSQQHVNIHSLEAFVLCPDPASHEENGLVTIEQFLSCANLVILILNKS